MGAFSELDMERSNFYSEEAAPAGFSLEDEAITSLPPTAARP